MDPIHEMYLWEDAKNDHSFQEKENFFTMLGGGIHYSQPEARKIWLDGKKAGFELGMNYVSEKSQSIQLQGNCKNENHKSFYNKFIKLCQLHNVAIAYHPKDGMIFTELTPTIPKNGHAGYLYCHVKNNITYIIESSKSLSEKGVNEDLFRNEFIYKCSIDKEYFISDSNS